MAKNTINYNLTLPDKAEAYDINVVNLNTTKIDAQIKSNEDKIKEVENSLDQLELKDTAIDVVAEEKKLNIVLSELREKDRTLEAKNVEQDTKIDEYKASVDDLNSSLTGYVARHKTANDEIRTIVGDKIEQL